MKIAVLFQYLIIMSLSNGTVLPFKKKKKSYNKNSIAQSVSCSTGAVRNRSAKSSSRL